MNKAIISAAIGISLATASLSSMASKKSCPDIEFIRNRNAWTYAFRAYGHTWHFVSHIYTYNGEAGNLSTLINLMTDDVEVAKSEMNKQLQTLALTNPHRGKFHSCDYTPKGADYTIEAYSPPAA